MNDANTHTACLCAICRKPITIQELANGTCADHHVLDFDGSLDYIELAHGTCARKWNRDNNSDHWNMD
jgi:hypothetical protein